MGGPPIECVAAVERAILEKLNELDMKITHLTSVVQSLAPRSSGQMVVDTEDDTFPFIFKMKRLSIRGGQTLKKTIWRVASKVFGPVAKQLNWCGRGDKRGLSIPAWTGVFYVLSVML